MYQLSLFDGIQILMDYDKDLPPHFNAKFANFSAVIDILEGTIIKGYLPNRQLKYVLAWNEMHKDELIQDWELSREHEPLERIKPL